MSLQYRITSSNTVLEERILVSPGSGPQWRTAALRFQIFNSEYQPAHTDFFLTHFFPGWEPNTRNYSLLWLDAVKMIAGKLIWDNHHSEPKPATVWFIHFASEDSNHRLFSDAASNQVVNPTHSLFWSRLELFCLHSLL